MITEANRKEAEEWIPWRRGTPEWKAQYDAYLAGVLAERRRAEDAINTILGSRRMISEARDVWMKTADERAVEITELQRLLGVAEAALQDILNENWILLRADMDRLLGKINTVVTEIRKARGEK